ncbi:MAG: (2Fe-2S) ferredoxin domain-containing protein [Oligoflexia bacterium]|nr:(2Fe-2S) ferredoxin domain-containing protein [Oligoflexia bacterium]
MKKEIHTHLFICTNDKGAGKQSCGQKQSVNMRAELKTMCRDLEGVRINAAGCLGRCEVGIAAVLYPEGKWFENLETNDIQKLYSEVQESVLKKQNT